MPTVRAYPHYIINVIDNSIYDGAINGDNLPIHRPLYVLRTRKGPVGTPVWVNTLAEAAAIFGADTFDSLNKTYFSDAAYFLNQTLPSNGAFIVRAATNSSVNSTKIVYATTAFTAESGSVTLSMETLSTGTFDALPVVANKYPILAFKATSAGVWGDLTGFRFFYDAAKNTGSVINTLKALRYGFTPVQKTSAGDIAIPINDKYGQGSNQVMLKPDMIDPDTGVAQSFKAIVEAAFPANKLPYEIYVYQDNIATIGGLAIDGALVTDAELGLAAGTLAGLTTDATQQEYGHLVNILTGEVRGGTTAYAKLTVTNKFTSSTSTMLGGGADGDIDDEAVETYIQNVCSQDEIPAMVDSARYPFTHLVDVGYTTDTKKALMDVCDWREDVKVIVSTQTMYDNTTFAKKAVYNTALEDKQAGDVLKTYAIGKKESILMGTEACRITLVMQVGRTLIGDKRWAPLTLWHAVKKAAYQNRDFLSREPKGLPYSAVEMFSEFNWVPSSEDVKSENWDDALNYCQYYSMTGVHYASVRSCYKYDTSVLVDDIFTDAIIYTKHIVRQYWAKYAGVTLPAAILQAQITNDLTKALGHLYNNKYVFTITVFQTEEEKKIGYIQHVQVSITAPATNRVWIVDIICNRENFNPTAA